MQTIRRHNHVQKLPKSGKSDFSNSLLALLFLLVLGLTGGLALSHKKALNDRLAYYQVASTLYAGGGFASPAKVDPRTPDTDAPYAVGERLLYPLMASIAFRFARPAIPISNFIAALFRSMAIFPLFFLGKYLWNRQVAFLSTVLFVLSPFYTAIGSVTMTDTSFTFFYYVTLTFAMLYWMRRQSRWLALAGLGLALTVWTREEGIVLAVALLALPLLRRQPRHLAMLAAFSVPLLGLRALYSWHAFGTLFYTPRPMLCMPRWELLFALHLPSCSQYLQATGGIGGALAVRLYNAVAFFRNLVADGLLIDTGVFGLLPPITAAVAVFGLWKGRFFSSSGSARGSADVPSELSGFRRWLGGALALQVGASIGVFGLPLGIGGEGGIRQAQVVLPYLLILAAAGLIVVWKSNRWGKSLASLALVNFVFFSFMAHTLLIGTLTTPSPPNAEIELLQKVSATLPSNSVLMSRKPNRAAYFAQHPAVMLPFASNRETLDYMRRQHVTHLLLTAQAKRSRPWLLTLLRTYPDAFHKIASVKNVNLYAVHTETLDDQSRADLWNAGPDPTSPVRVHWENLTRYRVRDTWQAFVAQWQSWRQQGL